MFKNKINKIKKSSKYYFNKFKFSIFDFFEKDNLNKLINSSKNLSIQKKQYLQLSNRIKKSIFKKLNKSKKTAFIYSKIYINKALENKYSIKIISYLKNNLPFLSSSQKDFSGDSTLLPPPPIWSRIFIWTLGTGTITLFLWSVFTKIEETIILSGELTTVTPEVQVSAMDPGKITEVLVSPNQFVEEGYILLIYEDDETLARLNSLKKRLSFVEFQRKNLFKSYDYKLNQLKTQIQIKEDIFSRLRKLENEGAFSTIELMQKESELKSLRFNFDSTLVEKDSTLYQNAEQLEQLSTQILELEAKINRFKIRAPVRGFIQNIKYQSPGERIMANDVVITIVPDNELIVKASIPSRVSAPIKEGMSAKVEVDAYPANDFGGILAEVETISPTVSTENSSGTRQRSYIAEIKLISPEIPGSIEFSSLRSGMATTTKIKLREKPIISSAFTILTDIFDPLAEEK